MSFTDDVVMSSPINDRLLPPENTSFPFHREGLELLLYTPSDVQFNYNSAKMNTVVMGFTIPLSVPMHAPGKLDRAQTRAVTRLPKMGAKWPVRPGTTGNRAKCINFHDFKPATPLSWVRRSAARRQTGGFASPPFGEFA